MAGRIHWAARCDKYFVPTGLWQNFWAHYYFPPLKISQSCDDVPMKRSIGSDNQALVREATKAWRASSGAAGGPPCNAAIIRLLLGQIMPQTLSIIMMPSAPPTPIESVLLLAKCWPFTVNPESSHFRITIDIATTKINATMANTRPSLVRAGTFLIIRNSTRNVITGMKNQTISSTHPFTFRPVAFESRTSALRMYIA